MTDTAEQELVELINRENPYAYLRRRAGLTLMGFCDTYHFAKQTLISIEAGQYTGLTDRMIRALGHACAQKGIDAGSELMQQYGVRWLRGAYERWRAAMRLESAAKINPVRPVRWSKNTSPMKALVEDTFGSQQGFSKSLKVPPSTLMRYTAGGQRHMPKTVEQALRDIEYPWIAELSAVQSNWYDEHRG